MPCRVPYPNGHRLYEKQNSMCYTSPNGGMRFLVGYGKSTTVKVFSFEDTLDETLMGYKEVQDGQAGYPAL